MKNNNLFHNLKQRSLKVSVSSIIFVSVVLLGGVIITLAIPSSLDDIKSHRANNQLIAENWDYLVEQMKSGWIKNGDNIYYNSGNVAIGNIPSSHYKMLVYNTTANYGLYVYNQTGNHGLYVTGTGRNYLAGNLGIGTTVPTTYRLNVAGSGNFGGPLYAPTPTASSLAKQVTTKEYVDKKISAFPSSVWIKNGNTIHYSNGNVGIGTSNPNAKLHVSGNIIASDPTASNHIATKRYVDNSSKEMYKRVIHRDNRKGRDDYGYYLPGNRKHCEVSRMFHIGNNCIHSSCVVHKTSSDGKAWNGSTTDRQGYPFGVNKFYMVVRSEQCSAACIVRCVTGSSVEMLPPIYDDGNPIASRSYEDMFYST